jgi:hypothetical protein
MGHRLPQALTAWGKFVSDVRTATHFFLKELYSFQTPPEKPLSDVIEKTERNAEIRERYTQGETIPELARAYGISNARVHQILRGRPNRKW